MLLAALLAALLAPTPAAAVRVERPRPALCARASLVVIAEVTGIEGRWGTHDGIESVVDVAVVRVVRGALRDDGLSIVTPGGTVGGLTQTISEAPRFSSDARYLLLLTATDDGWALVGGADGAIPLRWKETGAGESEASAVASLGGCRAS